MKKINFGLVKKSIANKSTMVLFEGEGSNPDLSKFMSLVKESEVLQLENQIFENLSQKNLLNNSVVATKYIDANLRYVNNFTPEQISEAHNKLKEFTVETDKIDNKKVEIFESINTLIENTGNDSMLTAAYYDSYQKVLDNLVIKEEVEEKSTPELVSEEIIEKAVDVFNKRFNIKSLSEDEKKIFELISEGTDENKENFLEETKKRVIEKLNEANKDGIEDKIHKTIEKVNETEYKSDTFVNDISKLIGLEQNLG